MWPQNGSEDMKSVKVEYRVRPEFAEENTANIRKVMDALRQRPIEGLTYIAFALEDGETFVHVNVARDEATLSKFTGTQEFKDFQSALKESDPVSPPAPQTLELVGASIEL